MRGNVILGVIAGLSVGAVLGVLLAPEKGSKTRKRIMRMKDDYYDSLHDRIDELKDKYQDVLDKMNERYNTAKEIMEKGAGMVREKIAG
jgi:gas vesicle protein